MVLSGVFKLTTSLDSTIPQRISTIFMSQKLDISIKGSTVNHCSFLFAFLKLEYDTQECYFSDNAISNFE